MERDDTTPCELEVTGPTDCSANREGAGGGGGGGGGGGADLANTAEARCWHS